MDLEITIRPCMEKKEYRKKMAELFLKYKNIKAFKRIADPMEWQRGARDEWEKRAL